MIYIILIVSLVLMMYEMLEVRTDPTHEVRHAVMAIFWVGSAWGVLIFGALMEIKEVIKKQKE